MDRPRLVTPELLEVCRSVFILSNVDGDSRREGGGGECAYDGLHGIQKDDEFSHKRDENWKGKQY